MPRQSVIAPMVLVGSAVLFFVAVWSLNHYYLGQLSVPAEVVYGEPLPAELKLLASFKTEDGLTADIYSETDHTKVGFAFSPIKAAAPERITGKDALRSLALFRTKKLLDPRFAPFTQRYASAQFDPMRAFDQEPVQMTVAGHQVEAIQFLTTSEWNHLFGVINLPNGQFVFQSVRKNSKVDPKTAIAILEKEIAASSRW